MKKKMKQKGIIALIILSVFSLQLVAQNNMADNVSKNVKLTIGDVAPKLSYSKWIQGNPQTINDDKTYVIEFWATWCGPCIHAMPHLSELSKKYKNIVFIGCDVMEETGSKPYESALPKVISFVDKQNKLGRLTYNVIADNNKEEMHKNWLVAAGIDGIPITFVINKGKIAWIGHPDFLDNILVSLENGSFNIEQAKKEYTDKNDPVRIYKEKLKENKDKIAKAEDAKDYAKALQYAEEAMVSHADYKFMYIEDKFRILLNYYGEDKAIAYIDENIKEGGLNSQVLMAVLYKKEDMSAKVNQAAVKLAKAQKMDFPKMLDILATFQARAGYYSDAAISEQKAIDMAKTLIKEKPDMEGYFNADVMNEYNEKLQEYKKK